MSEKVSGDPTETEAEAEVEPEVAIEVEVGDTGGDGEIAIEVDASEVDADPVAVLEARVVELEQEKKETYDRLLRATADLDNFRKRARRDVDDARVEARRSVLVDMLPVVDNLERAVEHAAKADQVSAESILEGVKLVLRQFVQAFERSEVTAFDSVGTPFDPNLHEAVGQIETNDHPPGAVATELQRGYKIGERLLRAAMVVVARAPAEPAEDAGANGHDKGNGSAGPAAPAADVDEPDAAGDGEGDS